MANEFIMFLTAGLVILVVMLILFGGGIPFTQTYRFGSGSGMGISHSVNGTILVGPEDVNAITRYSIDINTSYTKGETVHEAEGKGLFNGLLFGSNSIKYQLNSNGIENLAIVFEIIKTNNYAPLIIKVNDKIAEKKNFALGKYTVTADKAMLTDDITVELFADSSSWKIWAPAVYELDNIKIIENSYSYKPNEFKFVVKEDEYRTFSEGRIDLQLDNNAGNLIAELNDNPVYADTVSNYQSLKFTKNELRIGENVLQLKADVNSVFSGKAKMIIFYKTQREHLLEKLFNLTETEYNMFDRGEINFDIADVIKDGGLSIKILAGSSELFGEYSTAEERSYTYYFGKGNVIKGTNRVIIQSVDDAAFSVSDFEVNY
ncbi:MAG: hypothetical protein NT129_00100 [Candidatus Aenigmarchaeota archaeon]|nr:hypothetical protein [Candidatus Aenigmarchaeota archaeon]